MIILNKTALHYAVRKGDFEIVQLLLKHPKIDINAKSIFFYFKYHFKSSNLILFQQSNKIIKFKYHIINKILKQSSFNQISNQFPF